MIKGGKERGEGKTLDQCSQSLRDYETEVQDLPGHQSHNSGI